MAIPSQPKRRRAHRGSVRAARHLSTSLVGWVDPERSSLSGGANFAHLMPRAVEQQDARAEIPAELQRFRTETPSTSWPRPDRRAKPTAENSAKHITNRHDDPHFL